VLLKCTCWLDFIDYYCRNDVVKLMDLHASHRAALHAQLGLSIDSYVGAPGVADDAFKKFLSERGQLGPALLCEGQERLFEMFERAKKGGLAMSRKLHAQANNPYMGKYYNKHKAHSYLFYFDVTSLYAWVMMQRLPFEGHKLITDQAKLLKIVEEIARRAREHPGEGDPYDVGHLLYVKLRMPAERLAKNHLLQMPPFIQRMCPGEEELTDFQKEHRSCKDDTEKLIAHGKEWTEFDSISTMHLKLLIEQGVEVLEVEKAIEYTQTPFMRDFVLFCADQRLKCDLAGDKAGAQAWKQVLNSLWGRQMMNKRTFKAWQFFASWDQKTKDKVVSRDRFNGVRKVGEMWLASPHKTTNMLDVPIASGVLILEDAKAYLQRLMWEACAAWPEGAVELVLCDTDSLVFKVTTQDAYKDMLEAKTPEMKQWRSRLDLSAYAELPETDLRRKLARRPDMEYWESLLETNPSDPRCWLARNQTTARYPGFCKDVMACDHGADAVMTEVVSLLAKSYFYDIVVNVTDKAGHTVRSLIGGGWKSKGYDVSGWKVMSPLMELAKVAIDFTRKELIDPIEGFQIRSKDFVLRCMAQTKMTLNAVDNKFVQFSDGTKIPFGFPVPERLKE
jgi:hypothetical protein